MRHHGARAGHGGGRRRGPAAVDGAVPRAARCGRSRGPDRPVRSSADSRRAARSTILDPSSPSRGLTSHVRRPRRLPTPADDHPWATILGPGCRPGRDRAQTSGQPAPAGRTELKTNGATPACRAGASPHRRTLHGSRHHAPAPRERRALRTPDPSLEPEDEALHHDRAQRHLHHRPAAVAGLHRPLLRLHQGDGRQGRHDHVRGHQEAGPGGDRRAGDPRRDALRQPALAGRHAHQLPDRAPADQPPQGARRDRLRGRRRQQPHQEGAAADAPRARQAQQVARRHPRDEPHAVRGVDRRHQQGAPRRRGGPQAAHPDHRDPGLQLRPRPGRLPDPGQRRRDPRRRPADPRGRRRRRRGPDRPLRREDRRRRRGRRGRRGAAGRVGARAAGRRRRARPPSAATGGDAATETPAAEATGAASEAAEADRGRRRGHRGSAAEAAEVATGRRGRRGSARGARRRPRPRPRLRAAETAEAAADARRRPPRASSAPTRPPRSRTARRPRASRSRATRTP